MEIVNENYSATTVQSSSKGSNSMITSAYILSLIGGLLMVINGGMSWMMTTYYGPDLSWMWNMIWRRMGGWGMMGDFGSAYSLYFWLMLVGLACGVVVIVAAFLLNSRPADRRTWGILTMVFSVVSFAGIGGFFIGAILGIAGGALALS
jgi:Family of unknown function (DUF6114)